MNAPTTTLQVTFTYQTIREKDAGVPMPSALALPMAKAWDWMAANSPIRGPLMFSSDYIHEMKVGRGERWV